MVQFIPNFEVWSAFCPNPNCFDGEMLRGKIESFQRGIAIRVSVNEKETVLANFVFGSQSIPVCHRCFSLVPVPCLFPCQKSAESFWRNMEGNVLVRRLWAETGGHCFPSFIGIEPGNQEAFEQKSATIGRAIKELGEKFPPFLLLEVGESKFLSRTSQG